ncbi:hypothetical protein JCM3775_003769 [Rhodotorula graminis]
MAAAAHAQLGASADAFLSLPAFETFVASPRPPASPVVPLSWSPPPIIGLCPDLEQLECSYDSSKALGLIYRDACAALAERFEATLRARSDELRATFAPGDESKYLSWQQHLGGAFSRRYAEAADDMRRCILDEVRSAQARHAASPTAAHDPQEPGQFTPDVLAILHAAFNAADHVSKAERRTLAAATALSERQILTWFANQLQRRNKVGKKQQQQQQLGVRSAPYSAAFRPRPPQQQQQQQPYFDAPARRTVSDSSSGSSSLVDYESAHSSARSSASSDWSPTSGTYLAQGDIPFSLPYPPHLALSHHLDHLPPPPTHAHYPHDAPYPVTDERVDVPMMQLEAPTPLEGAFPHALAAPDASWAHPHALEPDSRVPLDALSALYPPSTSAGVDSRRSSADSAYSLAPAPSAEPAYLAPQPGFFLGAAPASTSAVAALGGLSDAWMDDQFYENLFGSLGLDLGGGGGATQDGAMSMGGEGTAPGLTLSMEAVGAEEQLVGGGGGEAVWF